MKWTEVGEAFDKVNDGLHINQVRNLQLSMEDRWFGKVWDFKKSSKGLEINDIYIYLQN